MKTFIGITEYNEIIQVELKEDKTIKGFNGFDLIHPDNTHDDNDDYWIENVSWSHAAEINGITLKSGDIIPLDWAHNLDDETVKALKDAYEVNTSGCESCGTRHDTDSYVPTFVFTPDYSEVYCKGCADVEDIVSPLTVPDDIFKAPSIIDMNTDNLIEVETLFCDSSGMGRSYEAALTPDAAKLKAQELINLHGENTLYVGITNAGQFQVYVTIFIKEQ